MDKPEIEIIPNKYYHYSSIWYIHSECCYTDCSKMVYGDENSIIINKVFCSHHYDIMNQFLNSYEDC